MADPDLEPAPAEESDRPEQLLKLADVLVVGPYMVWTARGIKNEYFRAGLTVIGVGTMLFTGYSLWRRWRRQRPPAPGAGLGFSPVVGNRRRLRYIPPQR